MHENHYDLMNSMFDSGWTTGKDLFIGAAVCRYETDLLLARTGPFGEALSELSDLVSCTIRIHTTTLQSPCASAVRLCHWNQETDPRTKKGAEFDGSTFDGCFYAWPGRFSFQVNYSNNLGTYDNIIGWPSTKLTNCRQLSRRRLGRSGLSSRHPDGVRQVSGELSRTLPLARH